MKQKKALDKDAGFTERTKMENTTVNDDDEEDEYEGYSRSNPPPWLDEFEYIDFMMTH